MVSTTTHGCATDGYRLLARVARMYHERGMRQPQIAADLRISQSSVSRLLQQASDVGIVRTVVSVPNGVYTDLEEELESRYGLIDSVVVDTGSSPDPGRALGASAASYLRETLGNGDVVGLPAWSPILAATVERMRPKIGLVVKVVAQISGGNGDPRVQIETTRLIDRFANVTGARPVLLPPPGMVNSQTVRRALLSDPAVIRVQQTWRHLTVAIVDIRGVHAHAAAQRRPGDSTELEPEGELAGLGAVGRICLRYFDERGELVNSHLNERLLGIHVDQLKAAPRRVGIACGPGMKLAIPAAIAGGWVNTLITDVVTARRLLDA